MLEVLRSFFDGLSAKEKKMFYISAFILGVMVFDRLIIGPISSESEYLKERIHEKTVQTGKNIRLLGYKDRILEEDAAYGPYYTKAGLSREVLIASFLGEVEGTAKTSGVTLSNINPVNVVEKDGYTELSLVLEFQGNMRDLIDFMYNIDSSQKPMRIRSFEISVRNRENYEVRGNVTVIKMIITRAEMAVTFAEENIVFITERIDLE